jgi:hypothetical protein
MRPASRENAGARRTLRRLVAERIRHFHDELIADLTHDNERFLREAEARAPKSAHPLFHPQMRQGR